MKNTLLITALMMSALLTATISRAQTADELAIRKTLDGILLATK